MDQDPSLIISCEHGGNQIPEEFQDLFVSAEAVLESHRGFDIGALSLAQKLARETKAPLVGAEISRLLIDLNRTLKQQTLFSEF
ncbi:MAG: N-formylglutamate amidohydrolase, partial [Desulfuromusa sp.]|nr:N-formylglutamate amidohydrolase [Desulfuromusa sp.]